MATVTDEAVQRIDDDNDCRSALDPISLTPLWTYIWSLFHCRSERLRRAVPKWRYLCGKWAGSCFFSFIKTSFRLPVWFVWITSGLRQLSLPRSERTVQAKQCAISLQDAMRPVTTSFSYSIACAQRVSFVSSQQGGCGPQRSKPTCTWPLRQQLKGAMLFHMQGASPRLVLQQR